MMLILGLPNTGEVVAHNRHNRNLWSVSHNLFGMRETMVVMSVKTRHTALKQIH